MTAAAARRLSAALLAAVLMPIAAADAADPSDRSAAEQRTLAFANDFWTNVFMPLRTDRFAEFFAVDYLDHNPNLTGKGLPGLIDYVGRLPPPQPGGVSPRADVVESLVDGDLVAFIRRRSVEHPADPAKHDEVFSFDLLRIRDGKIVEHWDAASKSAAPLAPTPAAAEH